MKNSLELEDLILYLFGLALTIALSFYFYQVHLETSKSTVSDIDKQMALALEIKDVEGSDNVKVQFLRAQLQVVTKRYELARTLERTNAYIKYIGFIVGTLLSLLGTMVIIRGVRESAIKLNIETIEQAKFQFLTSSPGVFMIMAGTAMIITTIVSGDELKVTDEGIVFPQDRNGFMPGNGIQINDSNGQNYYYIPIDSTKLTTQKLKQ